MDNPDHTFSPEALRFLGDDQGSLDAEALDLVDSWETSNADRVCDIDRTASTAPEGQYRAPSSQHRAGPWYSTFHASTDQGPRYKRAKFEDPKRRAEVAQVRKEGACIRCRWNKTPVYYIPLDCLFLSMIAHTI
jgi:hypothetical protein